MHIPVDGTAHFCAEARQPTARFARIFHKLAQRVCELPRLLKSLARTSLAGSLPSLPF